MICLKSSEFAILTNSGKTYLTMFISSCFNNYLIEILKIGKFKYQTVTHPTGFEHAIPGFEAMELLRNRMRKENWRTRLLRP